MAEYGREQRSQLSRAIANSRIRSGQLKVFADNRRQIINPCQMVNAIQLAINNLDDTILYNSDIYGIYDKTSKNKDNIIYIGQTCQGIVERFQQHAVESKESDQPWHVDNTKYDNEDETKWQFGPTQVYACKEFTPLEITASEEFFFEHYDGLSGKLCNRQQPLRKDTFFKYKNAGTFRPTQSGFDANWTPKQ